MSVKVIEIVQLLVDRVHQNGYQHRALEDDIYAEKEKRAAVEKDRDHWKAARQDAIEAGELMHAEIERLNTCLGKIRQHVAEMDQQEDLLCVVVDIRSALAELDAGTTQPEGQQ